MNLRRVLIPPEIPLEELGGGGSGKFVRGMTGQTMGTTWKAHCVLPVGAVSSEIYTLLAEAFSLVVRQMSHWDENSDLCRFNLAPAGTWSELPPEFFHVLANAVEIASLSHGAYDPTIGRLIDLYGFGSLPPPEGAWELADLESLSSQSLWSQLQLDPLHCRAYQPGGIELNLSSIAKGYAVDLAAESLLRSGVKNFLVEIGGELRGHGCKPNGMPWWCSLEMPPDPRELQETVVALCGLSIATSGDTVQMRLRSNGERISHLLDPRTAFPVSEELASVTVLHPTCLVADAWATALFVLGSEEGIQVADSQGLAALFTLRSNEGYTQRWSSKLEEMLA